MPNLHDIERRIGSVSSTKQITRTMEMVAAAKIRFASERVEKATPYSDSMAEMLADVATRVGGAENVTSVDNCITRLRLEVKDRLLVDEKKLKASGAAGVVRPGKTSVQVIIGPKVQFVADEFKKLVH